MESEKAMLSEFIECYRSNRVLWDTTSGEYLNKEKKESGYNELLDILKKIKRDAQVDDVKKKINTLRSSFRKELKKVKISKASGAGSENVYKPSLWWFDSMKFIEYLKEDESSKGEEFFTPTKSKRNKSKQDEMLPLACNYLAKGDDTFDHMAKTWASKLRRLSNTQRLFAEKAINDILFEAEMETLTRNSVKHTNDCRFSPSPNSSSSNMSTSLTEPTSRAFQSSVDSPFTITVPSYSSSSMSLPPAFPQVEETLSQQKQPPRA